MKTRAVPVLRDSQHPQWRSNLWPYPSISARKPWKMLPVASGCLLSSFILASYSSFPVCMSMVNTALSSTHDTTHINQLQSHLARWVLLRRPLQLLPHLLVQLHIDIHREHGQKHTCLRDLQQLDLLRHLARMLNLFRHDRVLGHNRRTCTRRRGERGE